MSRHPKSPVANPEAFDNPGKVVVDNPLQDEMSTSFLEYAYSVIHSRALPDARDGLKPVHRRILYGMNQMGLKPGSAFVKSSRVVGEVMGKYHPHGDSAIYDALVRLAQPWSMAVPLVEGHGNFGSPDDGPAAARYCVTGDTRVRLPGGVSVPIREFADATEDTDKDIDETVLDWGGDEVHASKAFNSGQWATKRITTVSRLTLQGSHNHPVLCLTTGAEGVPELVWRQLDEVQVGTRVCVATHAPDRCAVQSGITEGVQHDPLGVVLGAWTVGGTYDPDKAGVRGHTGNVSCVVPGQISDLVDAASTAVTPRRDESGEVEWAPTIMSGGRARVIVEADVDTFDEDLQDAFATAVNPLGGAPEAVWRGGWDVKRAYLSTLFSMQRAPLSKAPAVFTTTREALARDVQEMLVEFGMLPVRSSYEVDGRRSWSVTIEPSDMAIFVRSVGFLPGMEPVMVPEPRFPNRVPHVRDYVRRNLPESEHGRLAMMRFDEVGRWEDGYDEFLTLPLNDEVRRNVETVLGNGYRFDAVASVKDGGEKVVYSVKVDTHDHSFLAGGFVNHNTEARPARVTPLLLAEIDEDTVDFATTYDDSSTEPSVLPAAFPNLLVNGSAGIAVGMATNMIPHNLGEVIGATRHLLAHPDATLDDLMGFVPGPDLPTGGLLLGLDKVAEAYETGRGVVRMRARTEIGPAEGSRGRQAITVTELPYGVGPEAVIAKVKEAMTGKVIERGARRGEREAPRITGIADIKDLTDLSSGGTRLLIECKAGVNAAGLLADLFKYTPLESSFGINNLCLVEGQPRTLGLKGLLEVFLQHRREVVGRRTVHRRGRRAARLEVVDGLLKVLLDMDRVIAIIRSADNPTVAKTNLMGEFTLSDVQAQYILDTPLKRLTKMDAMALEQEAKTLRAEIAELDAITADPARLDAVIDAELAAILEDHPTPRRTTLIDGDLQEVLTAMTPAAPKEVADDPCQVLLTTSGLIARTATETDALPPQQQTSRNGRSRHDGIAAATPSTARGGYLAVTNRGRAFRLETLFLPVVPDGSAVSMGAPIARVVTGLDEGERVVGLAPATPGEGAVGLALGTKSGIVKITTPDWPVRSDVFDVIGLRDGDEVTSAVWVDSTDVDMVFVTSDANLLRFPASKVRPQGAKGGGVAGINLPAGDQVVAFTAVKATDAMVVTSTGGGVKVTPLSKYPTKGRATGGVRCQRFLKGETRLVYAWVGDRPVASTTDGRPLSLPEVDPRRDASGVSMMGPDVVGSARA